VVYAFNPNPCIETISYITVEHLTRCVSVGFTFRIQKTGETLLLLGVFSVKYRQTRTVYTLYKLNSLILRGETNSKV